MKVLVRLRGCAGSPEPFTARIGDKYQIRFMRPIYWEGPLTAHIVFYAATFISVVQGNAGC